MLTLWSVKLRPKFAASLLKYLILQLAVSLANSTSVPPAFTHSVTALVLAALI